MEAAAPHLRELPEWLRARGFERECERLRPLGEAYVLRRFGQSLDRADAEDAVAEVVIRLHRAAAAGRAPENLRAAFFTAVRNAAIDQLRSRSARPTVPLEVVAEAPLAAPGPAERAEASEQASRLREALARMRPNYREAITLRFGLGLTVPEIAERLDVSLPAAKKLVLRATAQARKRLAAVEGEEFCPQMRDLARQAVFDREAVGLLDGDESKLLHAHLAHCGPCRSFLAHLHEDLHELAGGALVVLGAGETAALGPGLLGRARELLGKLGEGVGIVQEKARIAAFRAGGALSSGDGSGTGILAGSSQKIAAVCTVGAAGAGCLASGVIGPGLGAGVVAHHLPSPPAKVRRVEGRVGAAGGHHLVASPPLLTRPAPAEEAVVKAPAPRGTPKSGEKTASSKESGTGTGKGSKKKSRAEETEAEFGFESQVQASASSAGEAVESAPPPTTTSESETTSQSYSSASTASSPSTSSSSSAGSSGGSSGSGGTDFGGFEK